MLINNNASHLACFTMLALLGACAVKPDQPRQFIAETAACMNYRAMMVTPMPPSEIQRLKAACEQSRLDAQTKKELPQEESAPRSQLRP